MKYFVFFALVFSLISCNNEKTAYVNSDTLVNDYYVMKSYRDSINQQQQQLQQKFDEQMKALQAEYAEFQKNARKMSPAKAEKKNLEINQKYQQMQQIQQMESYQLQQQSQKRLSEIIDEVTGYIKEYGDKNGYTYIFATNEGNPSVIYAKPEKDLTDVLLKELNAGHEDAAKEEKKEATAAKEQAPAKEATKDQ